VDGETGQRRTAPDASLPFEIGARGGIRNLVSCFGIEDRGDGGGGVSLASKPEALKAQLQQYAGAQVGDETRAITKLALTDLEPHRIVRCRG
jgi:hypothetical protein